tara:strand:- start:4378 stop:4554 length:177 start_codon:yes stop_codon:yes gene_type:complete
MTQINYLPPSVGPRILKHLLQMYPQILNRRRDAWTANIIYVVLGMVVVVLVDFHNVWL